MHILRDLDTHNFIDLFTFRHKRIFRAYNSTKNTLTVDTEPVMTKWASEVNWNLLTKEIEVYYDNLTPKLKEEYLTYHHKKLPFHLSYFSPATYCGQLIQYGAANQGIFNENFKKRYHSFAEETVKEIEFPKLTHQDISDGHTDIDELIGENWLYGILNTKATSAWPWYTKQTPEFILENYYAAQKAGSNKFITAYARRHGKGWAEDDKGNEFIQEKDRFVGGTSFDTKVEGLPITGAFKQSVPSWTAYYRPWKEGVFDMICNKLVTKKAFTSDQSKFDIQHNEWLLTSPFNHLKTRTDDPRILKVLNDQMENCYNDPTIIMTATHALRLGRWISVSGAPSTPLIESINNRAVHLAGLADQEVEVDKGDDMVQIDDMVIFLDDLPDLHALSDYFGEEAGFLMNPDKTETSDKGYITYLQVNAGELYDGSYEPNLMVEESFNSNGIYYFGNIPRRLHRLRYRERGASILHGDIIMEDEEGKQPEDDVQRMLGSLGSLGPQVDLNLLDIFIKHLSPTETYRKVVEFVKRKPSFTVGEWGFDPKLTAEYIASLN